MPLGLVGREGAKGWQVVWEGSTRGRDGVGGGRSDGGGRGGEVWWLFVCHLNNHDSGKARKHLTKASSPSWACHHESAPPPLPPRPSLPPPPDHQHQHPTTETTTTSTTAESHDLPVVLRCQKHSFLFEVILFIFLIFDNIRILCQNPPPLPFPALSHPLFPTDTQCMTSTPVKVLSHPVVYRNSLEYPLLSRHYIYAARFLLWAFFFLSCGSPL